MMNDKLRSGEAATTPHRIAASEALGPTNIGADSTATAAKSARPYMPLTANQDLHDKALKLLLLLCRNKTEQNAADTNKSYNQRRKDVTNALRPVLAEIWHRFENGESVGGCNGKKAWAKSQSITIRWCQKVIAGSQTEANSVRLRVGKVVKIGDTKCALTQEMLDAIVALAATYGTPHGKPEVVQSKSTVLAAENQPELEKQAARKNKAEPAPKKVQPKQSATRTAELVLVARIGDTREFGVFPKSETEYTAAKALAIGALQYCEAERDRINAKRMGAESPGTFVAVANIQMPQEAVAVL